MKKMTLSAIVLGLAAAGAIAQTAPAAAQPAAQPAAAQPAAQPAAAPAAQPAADQKAVAAEEAKKAEEAKAAEEAKKAEEAKAAEEAKKAEEAKAAEEAKKAEEAKAAEEAKKAEEAKAAEEAKKAEEAKAAEAKTEETKSEDKGEVSQAAGSALDMLKASMNEATSEAKMEVKFSGEVEFDAYTGDVINDDDLNHSYASTFDLNVDVQFNDKWSAFVGLEADGESTDPAAIYNGAFVQYKPADFFAVKLGDLTFSEGAFVAYYGYDDPADDAAGMTERDIRGMEIDLAGLQLGFGFGRGDNDVRSFCVGTDDEGNPLCQDDAGKNYSVHAAYEFEYAGQHLRPYVNYKSFQSAQHNELHAGVDAGLNIGGFGFRAVYGFHADYLGDDGDVIKDVDLTSTAHTILAEPTFEVSMFEIKTTFFYAFIDEAEDGHIEAANDFQEYFFIYGEPAFKFAEFIKIGIPVEFHKNTLNDDDDTAATLDVGGRVYISPVENLELTAFGMVDIAMQDNEDDTALRFGLETVFSF